MNKNTLKGQALLELAIFGSFVLFCLAVLVNYGMSGNYNDYLQMSGFRRALQLSYDRSNRPQGVNSQVTLAIVSDKFIPDPTSFGASEASPFQATYSAAWSAYLMGGFSTRNIGDRDKYPSLDYLINDWYQTSSGARPVQGGAIENSVGFTTAGARQIWNPCSAGNCRKKIDVAGNGIWWAWREGIGPMTIESGGEYYVRLGGTLDVDNDYTEEHIVILNRPCETCAAIDIWVLDPNSAEINQSAGNIVSADYDSRMVVRPNKDANGLYIYQGLQPAYTKQAQSDNNVIRTEDSSHIVTTTRINNNEIIRRSILTNSGSRAVTGGGGGNAEQRVRQNRATTWDTPF